MNCKDYENLKRFFAFFTKALKLKTTPRNHVNHIMQKAYFVLGSAML